MDPESFCSRVKMLFDDNNTLTQADLARQLGISPPYLYKILYGKFKTFLPPADLVLKISKVFNVSYEWLITGKTPKENTSNKLPYMYPMVSESDPNISIHNGTVYFDDTYKNHSILLTKREIENQDKIKKILITDNAMSPLIKKGDYVLIYFSENLEKSFNYVQSGKIYVFFVNLELYCRRLYKQLDGSIVVKAENKDYVEVSFTKEELDDRVIIVGPVFKREGYVE